MSRRTAHDEDDARSTDGSDSEGSLKEFILHSEEEEEEEEEIEVDASTLANELIEEFPYDKSLLSEERKEGVPRRSRRARKVPTRYVDDRYAQLMYDDVEMDKLSDSDDEARPVNNESDDDDYDEEEDSDDEFDEEDEEEEEETLTSDPPVVVKISKKRVSSSVAAAPAAKRTK